MASDRAKRQMAAWTRQNQTERVLYRPSRAGQENREITVVVDRPGPTDVQSGQVKTYRVLALNDELEGIPSSPDLSDIGRDQIDVAERLGGPSVTRGMQRFIEQSADFVKIEIL